MSDWRLYSLCPGCSTHFDRDTARFLYVCPECGHEGEWHFGPTWPQRTMRCVSVPFPGFRWMDPRTWFRGTYVWETKP